MPESFFDFRSRVTKPSAVADEARLDRAMSVADLTAKIDGAIRAGVGGAVLVRGEISNLNAHAASGHVYFTLKDDQSCIDCVMFRGEAAKLAARPIDGQDVLVSGSVRVYQQRGRYQLYCVTMTPLGAGALERKFQELRRRLEAEGLFDDARKRPLPAYPQRILLITSKQAAALQDMLKVFARTPWLTPKLAHVPVQGVGAAEQIAAALRAVTTATDLVLLSRGGGSLEDLWPFNEEVVARAVRACAAAVITGVGHEVDVSIADLAADYHAHTPTEAAQVAIAGWRAAGDFVDGASRRLGRAFARVIVEKRQRLTAIERHEVFRRPTDRLDRLRQLLDDREKHLRSAAVATVVRARRTLTRQEHRLHGQHPIAGLLRARQRLEHVAIEIGHAHRLRLTKAAGRLDALHGQLVALDSNAVLRRGYSITRLRNGQTLTHVGDVRAGDILFTQLSDGVFESTARDAKQMELFGSGGEGRGSEESR